MLEAEFITDDVSEVIEESIKLIQFIGQSLLKYPDLLTQLEKDLPSRIIQKISEEFKIISYKDASLFLGKEILGSKEEKDLMEKMSSSVVLTDFPIAQKPFYMKQIGDTTKSFDILVKGVGEVVGGSLREKSSKVLKDRMTISSIQTLQWYLDMREVDEMATGGFGLGFERILMYFLELDSIKDIVPFPRWMGRMDI
jgi:asparaginyl-tRNA synthetase